MIPVYLKNGRQPDTTQMVRISLRSVCRIISKYDAVVGTLGFLVFEKITVKESGTHDGTDPVGVKYRMSHSLYLARSSSENLEQTHGKGQLKHGR